ncbi:hypothetical protein [Desemzia sp. FAM 23989]|uniref:hypothetical protein n=1 Tax=Desemzia sp. FAM 23989 TaxID=3259523 RepID=UPI0038894AAD
MVEGLTKNQLKIISELAAQEAIRTYEKTLLVEKKEKQDRRLRNTELLLKNYRKLKDHCSEIDSEIEEFEGTILDMQELTIESLMRYRYKTVKMLKHVDKMLIVYEWDCGHGSEEEKRRYSILKKRYLIEDRRTVKELCEELSVEQATVYRDTKRAIKDIAILLFGIDALEFKI